MPRRRSCFSSRASTLTPSWASARARRTKSSGPSRFAGSFTSARAVPTPSATASSRARLRPAATESLPTMVRWRTGLGSPGCARVRSFVKRCPDRRAPKARWAGRSPPRSRTTAASASPSPARMASMLPPICCAIKGVRAAAAPRPAMMTRRPSKPEGAMRSRC